jgi:hypothetical protein
VQEGVSLFISVTINQKAPKFGENLLTNSREDCGGLEMDFPDLSTGYWRKEAASEVACGGTPLAAKSGLGVIRRRVTNKIAADWQ